jgi:hypothetical protein
VRAARKRDFLESESAMGTLGTWLAGLGLVSGTIALAPAAQITPGVPWYDTDSNLIQAHAGCVLRVGSTWYWYGEDTRSTTGGCEFACFGGIRCYSSTDLQDWHSEGVVLSPRASGPLSPSNGVAYRPKVLYNGGTGQYVMILTECCPSSGHLVWCTADTPTGPFTYQRWSTGAENSVVMDMTAFQDDDGSAYVIYSDNNSGVAIDQLSSDYLSVVARVCTFGDTCEEAPCLVKSGGRYYLYNSYCSGWIPNQGHYRGATNIAGPWSPTPDGTLGDATTYQSQGACFLTVTGTATTTVIYVGDRWDCPELNCDISTSRYIWLPLTISDGTMSLNWYDTWTIDPVTGLWLGGAPNLPVLGNAQDGSSSDSLWNRGAWINACQFQAAADLTLTTMCANVTALVSGHYKCAIYADTAGNPGAFLRDTSEVTNPSTNGWFSFPLTSSLAVTNGQQYWLAIWADVPGARVFYNGTAPLQWGSYPYTNAWPDPLTTSGAGSFQYCLYATGPFTSAYSAWKYSYGLAGASDASDSDGDGIPLLLEYALAGNPLVADSTALWPVGGRAVSGGATYLTLTYRQNKEAMDVTFVPEAAGELANGAWSAAGIVGTAWTGEGQFWLVTVRDSVPVTNAPYRFMRLKVTRP